MNIYTYMYQQICYAAVYKTRKRKQKSLKLLTANKNKQKKQNKKNARILNVFSNWIFHVTFDKCVVACLLCLFCVWRNNAERLGARLQERKHATSVCEQQNERSVLRCRLVRDAAKQTPASAVRCRHPSLRDLRFARAWARRAPHSTRVSRRRRRRSRRRDAERL